MKAAKYLSKELQQQREALLKLPFLTDDERAALEGDYARWGTLDPLEKQRLYLLGRAIEPMRCPACKHIAPEIACRTGGENHRCPSCGAGLKHCIALIGGEQFWTLTPGQAVEIR